MCPPLAKQADERRLEVERPQIERRDVTVQMVDRRERKPARPRERLRCRDTDQQRSDQAGMRRHRDGFDVGRRCACPGQRFRDNGNDELEVPAARDLGHHATETRMEIGLRGDDVGDDLSVRGHERGRGLVARRLDPEDHVASESAGGRVPESRHMINASSRLSV